jgi:hypothetical protein
LIFRRVALALAAAACLAAAAAMAVVALGYALFALLRDPLGPSGAAACVVVVAALIAAIAGFVLMQSAKVGRAPHKRRGGGGAGAPANLTDSMADLVRDRPAPAAALAAAVGFVLTRSPGLAGVLGTLISRQGRDRRD